MFGPGLLAPPTRKRCIASCAWAIAVHELRCRRPSPSCGAKGAVVRLMRSSASLSPPCLEEDVCRKGEGAVGNEPSSRAPSVSARRRKIVRGPRAGEPPTTASASASDLVRARWHALSRKERMRCESRTPGCLSEVPTTRWRTPRTTLTSTSKKYSSVVGCAARSARQSCCGIIETYGQMERSSAIHSMLWLAQKHEANHLRSRSPGRPPRSGSPAGLETFFHSVLSSETCRWHSVALGGTRRHSVACGGTWWHAVAIGGDRWHSVALGGHLH